MRTREIIIIIGLCLSLLLFGVIAVLDQAVDPTDNTNPNIRENNIPAKTAMMHHLIEGLSTIDKEGRTYIHLDSYDVNELLYSLLPKLDFGSVKARSIYIEESESGHRLCMPVQIFGFKTMLSGEVIMFTEGDNICATVSDLRVAKLPLDEGSLSGVKGMIISMLMEQGIIAYFDGVTLNLTVTREAIGNLIALRYKNDPNLDLINAMYSLIMLKTDSVSIDVASPTDIRILADFGSLGMTEEGRFSGLNAYVTDLLSRGVIGKEHTDLISKYYLNGYSSLTEEEGDAVKQLLSAEIGEEEIASYGGLIERGSLSITQLLISQLDVGNSFTPGFKISDGDINTLMTSLPVIGTVWTMTSYRDGGFAYIAISDVLCDISDDLISISVGLEVNGRVINISAEFATGESPLVAVRGMLVGASVGSIRLDEGEMDLIFGFMCDHLNEDWIYTDREGRTVTLDFTFAFSDSPLLSFLLSSRHIVSSCHRRPTNDGGYINITFRLFG